MLVRSMIFSLLSFLRDYACDYASLKASCKVLNFVFKQTPHALVVFIATHKPIQKNIKIATQVSNVLQNQNHKQLFKKKSFPKQTVR